MGQMIAQFNRDNIEILKQLGYEVQIAANFTSSGNTMNVSDLKKFTYEMEQSGVKVHQIDFERGMGTISSNLKAWGQLVKLCKNNEFDFIHCQSPLGGVFGRLIGGKFNVKVMYTVHGFHFFKGSPKLNWIVFYPVEKWLSKYTNILITINEEDFQIAQRMNKNMKVFKIPGVGINWKRINERAKNVDIQDYRKKLNIPNNGFVITSVGELSVRKNQITVLKGLKQLNNENIHYLICGIGKNEYKLRNYVSKNNISNVHFLGYRTDIPEIYGISDISAFLSKREGLGLAGLEAMAAGLPLVCSNINGMLEYASDGVTGYLMSPSNVHQFELIILKLLNMKNLNTIKNNNYNISRKFDKSIVHDKMQRIYEYEIK